MNGFANSLLSFLLSWIRALAANLWAIANSEDGGVVYRFFAEHWQTLLLILLVGGFLADRLIYLIRWKPHYVWLSRMDRLRRKRKPQEDWSEPDPVPEIRMEPAQPMPEPIAAPTLAYAPLRKRHSEPDKAYAQIYASPASEPVFDEPIAQWDDANDWQAEAFDRPMPDPASYYKDVQAGFAPAIPPEQLYAPRVQMQDTTAGQVHPGLDAESFRQSIGLEEQPQQPVPVMRAPAFRPFTSIREEEVPVRPNPFARLARLVGVDDEEKPLTYRDLHATVDVSQAFHEPVYPQGMKSDE